jgi:hypothetical protein
VLRTMSPCAQPYRAYIQTESLLQVHGMWGQCAVVVHRVHNAQHAIV